ncbi:hypothetical protein [Pleionea mediterranea]|uniref:Uncharacterized protein n=1 Tax=Pleionea mediterranea TaxID=523701 RepID=A0A316G0A0_9GAMM|nr:hypothetical protein [Pleionea mediterranea]PWK54331.1 hypothetical protein C8D97_101179 [Pleionea mediterranea]
MITHSDEWLIHDKDWVKDRKNKWKDFEFNLISSSLIEKEYMEAYKLFYLKGDENAFDEVFPRYDVNSIILEMWLHPATSPDFFSTVVAKCDEKAILETAFRQYTPDTKKKFHGVSHYCGRDLMMYEAIFPKVVTRESYPNLSDNEYVQKVKTKYIDFFRVLLNFFREEYNPYNYCTLALPYWKSCIMQGYHEHPYLKKFINYLDDWVLNCELKNREQVSFSNRVLAIFEDPELPSQALDAIKEARMK